ncbi:27070_t:CDS:2 [Dentiscutata erythropus]|uniref:27070_t:CDS:1 n=1 Tax=Dentiscutata erythropus TaxID=1348616 RepID=A0A9N9CP26_9GLOM|nr:27070_t:CDS:2 [Dentiscutata erythropus]
MTNEQYIVNINDIINGVDNKHEDEITLGISYFNLGLYDDSFAQFDCILENTPKQYDKSLSNFCRVLEIDPYNSVALSICGMFYYLLNQYYKAFLNFNKALCVNSFDITALFYRGKAYFELGHYNKAFMDIKKVLEQYNRSENLLEIQSNHVDALILHAKICFNLEEYENAIIYLSEALKLQPKNSTILTLRGGYLISAYNELDFEAMKYAVIDNSEIIKLNDVIAYMLCGEAK